MNTYLAIKHLHVLCVILSAAGFILRGILMLLESPRPRRQSRLLKMAPHVNDTVLLAAAVALAIMSNQYPFVDAWVTAKVFGLIAYIILGSLALKEREGRSKPLRGLYWVMALLTFGYIVSVALTRNPLGALSPLLS